MKESIVKGDRSEITVKEGKSHIYNMGDFYQALLNKANTYYAGNEK